MPSDNSKAQSEEYNYTRIFVIILPEAVDNSLDLALFFYVTDKQMMLVKYFFWCPPLFTKTAPGVLFP